MIKKILNFRFSLCFLFFVFILSSTTFSQIIDFNPKTITAGTGSVLTFTGIGFGSSRGPNAYVAFSRQDPTNLTVIKVLESDYILWTDTKIQVKVPAGAGTGGPIIIIDRHAAFT
ncbi:IPT/TIG domain-containing protein [Pedobacter sp. UC225_65]|uniref:IPT/TIG domain-containing protein n=1 Tax=Pedobacter sp. UC225_65 TaxID=3350173 RepID=UPI00366F1B13